MSENSDNIVSKDGMHIITLSSWQEFHQEVNSLKSKRGYVWRGQKRDETSGWSLQPSFDRKVQSKSRTDRSKKLKRHLKTFKEAMNKFYPGILPRDDIDIWALGQHYGLKTPLLDWTLSPYIAAYFAFSEGVDQNEKQDNFRYVFALSRSIERLISKQKKASQVLSSARSVPFVDRLPYLNPRFTAQKGIFTIAFKGNDVQEYARTFSRQRPGEVVILKFRIPTRDREKCLSDLRLMNIDHTSLLLDLRPVVDHCNSVTVFCDTAL